MAQRRSTRPKRRPIVTVIGFLTLLAVFAPPTFVRADGGLAPLVSAFHDDLLNVMKNAKSLGIKGRYDQLYDPINRTFHIPLMSFWVTRGEWEKASETEQKALVSAARRMSAGELAVLFDGYNNETFHIAETTTLTDGSTLVTVRIDRPGRDSVRLAYRARKFDDGWRLVDVLLNGTISQVLKRKEEYSRVLRREGLPGLTALLNNKADEILALAN